MFSSFKFYQINWFYACELAKESGKTKVKVMIVLLKDQIKHKNTAHTREHIYDIMCMT